MWESGISLGAFLMYSLWLFALGLVGVGWVLRVDQMGQLGIVCSALAAALTVMRDNQRTRRMMRRPDERVTPLR